VFDKEGRPVVEVDEDDVTATVEGAPPTRFREVEVESTPDADPELVDALVERLKRAGADPADSQPKIARALGERASEPPDLPAPEPLGKSATIGALVRRSITAAVQRLLDHDPVVRVGEDAEGVHQARVATRRLRSDLRTFRPLVDTEWSEPLRNELSWLGELLGRVRDADVLLGLLADKAGRLTETERAHANDLIDRLRATRDRDQSVLLDAMRSERYTMLLDQLVEAARAPRLRDELSNERAKTVVRKLARRPVKRLRKQIRGLSADPTDAQLHEARKRAKQARYAFEAIAPVAGKGAARRARRLADLQSVLGDHQDTVVAVAWLHDAALDSPGSETPFVAGHLAGAFDADRTRLRDRWPRVWKRVERALP
jgi:CHAD domain-containing protein